ncbi:MAG TPA: YkgJ family cysteine cluster protein [Candidatus Nanoarchaeia archaeon]|nr:YkgJ family cysteine cluster protein [Candidatus Nanoarchaeia archaeon]
MKTPDNFKCTKCGLCCFISPFLKADDIKRIENAGYPREHFLEELRGKKFMKMDGGKCIFLKKVNEGEYLCSIYEHRPETCRKYPTEVAADGCCAPAGMKYDEKIFKPWKLLR